MPDSIADGHGQVPPAPQSPDGNGQVPPTSQVQSSAANSDSGTSSSPSTPDGLTLEQALSALKKAREEAAKHRIDGKELAELRQFKQQIEESQLSETEKLQKQFAALQESQLSETEKLQKQFAALQEQLAEKERQTQERVIRADVRAAARDLGLNEKLAYRLLDYTAIEFNDDGDPTNVAELLANAMAEYGLAAAAQTAQQQQPSQQQPASSQPVAAAPAMGATNPPRGSQVAGANGTFARGEIPKLTDPRLWKR